MDKFSSRQFQIIQILNRYGVNIAKISRTVIYRTLENSVTWGR